VQLSFRAKLILITATTALGFILTLGVGALSSVRQNRQLDNVEGRLVPKLELRPRLEASFERLRQSMQDAVAAEDVEALDGSRETKNELLSLIGNAESVLTTGESVALRHAINDYYAVAYDVSRRLIRHEGGEAIVDAMSDMRARHLEAGKLVERVAPLDKNELTLSFAAVRDSNRQLMRNILGVGAGCFVLALMLGLWVARAALRTVSHLSSGFGRFAVEDFSQPIPVLSSDELGAAARAANTMATALQALAAQRDHSDWIRTSIAELSDELRGDPSPTLAAAASIALLCRKLRGGVGLFYLADPAGKLVVAGQYGLGDAAVGAGGEGFHVGEGLIGQACRADELLVIDEPPEGYFRVRSGLGEAPPRSLVFVPLRWRSRVVGVVELGLLDPCSARCRELLTAVRELLAVRLDALTARELERELLSRTREQAERLTVQEEELRANNTELSVQQEELRATNQLLELQRGTLTQQNVELESMRRGLEDKARELEKVSTYKSHFLANMSHELRTPLNSMLLLSHLLSENESGNLTRKQVDYSRTIHSAGVDLLGLINQVLDLAKVESGRQDVNLEPVLLAEVGAHAFRSFEAMAKERGLQLVVEQVGDLPLAIVTDRQRLERILINLIGNAIKFTTQGQVSLVIGRPRPGAAFERSTSARQRCVTFEVIDTGIGIAPVDQERIFAPFEQVESRIDRRYGGTGLGLAIARESARLLGGELMVESERGRGSTFTLLLPEAPEGHATALPAFGAPAGRVQQERELVDDRVGITSEEPYLLLIEDDRVFAELLVDIIHTRHFKVIVARTGEEGLRVARERRPIGIVLDVRLPDISGWTVMEHLRRDPRTRTVPVHFISGVDAPERGLALGAVGYLTKPATRSELIGVVQALQRPRGNGSSKILLVEDDLVEGESLMSVLGREGLEATLVKDAAAALVALDRERFGCMILDLGLPDMDGLGLLTELHARPGLQTPPVVVHTARTLTKDEMRRIETYAKAIVLKDGSSKERLLDEVKQFAQQVSAELPGRRPAALLEASPSSVSLEGKKILVAEDDMRTVYALSALLRAKGAEVIVAETGQEALDLLAQNLDVHGVLMDIMMPEMDGYEAMRQLRAQERFRDLPVIALTAKAMKGEQERCLEVGASDYLSKPVDPAQLLSKLDAWLATGSPRVN
jgi:CheY-like chemotaxis protein/signal transduction histidine kinase/HAMP domain-containing protein